MQCTDPVSALFPKIIRVARSRHPHRMSLHIVCTFLKPKPRQRIIRVQACHALFLLRFVRIRKTFTPHSQFVCHRTNTPTTSTGSLDGAFGHVIPLDEGAYSRLQFLQVRLTGLSGIALELDERPVLPLVTHSSTGVALSRRV